MSERTREIAMGSMRRFEAQKAAGRDEFTALERAVLKAAEGWREADLVFTKIEKTGRRLSDEGRGAAEGANDLLWRLRHAIDELVRARPGRVVEGGGE